MDQITIVPLSKIPCQSIKSNTASVKDEDYVLVFTFSLTLFTSAQVLGKEGVPVTKDFMRVGCIVCRVG